MSRMLSALVVATAMLLSSAAVAGYVEQGALPPGKAATLKQAQSYSGKHKFVWLMGASVIVGGVVMAASGDSHGASSTVATSSSQPQK
jgi:hypothetical protein